MAEWKFIGARRYECSACGEGIAEMPCDWANGEPLYNFCPYCGANMTMKKSDGVKDEPNNSEKPNNCVDEAQTEDEYITELIKKKCKGEPQTERSE